MKKTFMIAIAGMMLFAFTQCDNGNKENKESGEKVETTESVNADNSVEPVQVQDLGIVDSLAMDVEPAQEQATGSKQFVESKKYLEDMINILENVKTCEDFGKVSGEIARITNEMQAKTYTDDEKMTLDEMKTYGEIATKFAAISQEKANLCL